MTDITENLKPVRNTDVDETGDADVVGMISLHWFNIINDNAAAMYVKFYDKATGAAAADTPEFTVKVGIGANLSDRIPDGARFNLGLSIRAVTTLADLGNVGPGANEVMVSAYYRDIPNAG